MRNDTRLARMLHVLIHMGRHEERATIGLSTDHPQCLVEQAVNAALTDAFDQAQALLMARLGDVTLAQLADDFDQRYRVAMAP